MNAPKTNASLKPNKESIVDHDPQHIRFTYWSALLSFNDVHPSDTSEKQNTIFLENHRQNSPVREGVANTSISIKNNCNFAVLNVNIFSKKAGKTVFSLPELPDKKSIRLEFKQEGTYELHFFIAGSTAFTKITFKILPETIKSSAKNFDWDLKLPW